MRVTARIDASELIGGGHAMRCLTLANALAEHGAKVTFVTAAMPESIEQRIAGAGHRLVRIPASPELDREGPAWHEAPLSDAAQLKDAAAAAAAGDADWMVVDHYLLDATWHEASRRFASKVLVMDDLANRSYDCDLLLDQTLGRSASDYAGLVPETAEVLAGTTYAVLRPEFARERPAALKRRQESSNLRRILVTMGTTDPGGVTARIVDEILAAAPACAIDVVLGPQAPSLDGVQQLARSHAKVTLHVDSHQMAVLMRDADLAIGAAGSTSWERCCLGLPTIALVLAENQQSIGKALAATGAHITIDPDDQQALANALAQLLGSPQARARMSERAADVIDGEGTGRVLAAMCPARTRERAHG